MKILLVIDNLGSGGAQRQLITLALGLAERGHSVDMFNYFPRINFFRSQIEAAGIKIFDCHKMESGFSLLPIKSLRKIIATQCYQIAISFLDSPSIYLLLSSIFNKNTKVIVSDRNSFLKDNQFLLFFKRQIYRLANAVVTNSHSQSEWLVKNAFLPNSKVFTVYNGYDDKKINFAPCRPPLDKRVKLIGVGRIAPQKNIETLIDGLACFEQKNGWCPKVTWVGRIDSTEYFNRVDAKLNKNPLIKNFWFWAGEQKNVFELLENHHALVSPSLYEGLSNVICEALFAGKPVLASNICDNTRFIKAGKNGFTFNPDSKFELASIIQKFTNLDSMSLQQMCYSARESALANFSLSKYLDSYESIFNHLLTV